MQPDEDPWSAELEALLSVLGDENELVYRLAMQGEYPRLMERHGWDARVKALSSKICRTTDDWHRVLVAVTEKAAEMFGDQGRSPAPRARRSHARRRRGT